VLWRAVIVEWEGKEARASGLATWYMSTILMRNFHLEGAMGPLAGVVTTCFENKLRNK
jgi:hypothetical protein